MKTRNWTTLLLIAAIAVPATAQDAKKEGVAVSTGREAKPSEAVEGEIYITGRYRSIS